MSRDEILTIVEYFKGRYGNAFFINDDFGKGAVVCLDHRGLIINVVRLPEFISDFDFLKNAVTYDQTDDSFMHCGIVSIPRLFR